MQDYINILPLRSGAVFLCNSPTADFITVLRRVKSRQQSVNSFRNSFAADLRQIFATVFTRIYTHILLFIYIFIKNGLKFGTGRDGFGRLDGRTVCPFCYKSRLYTEKNAEKKHEKRVDKRKKSPYNYIIKSLRRKNKKTEV